MIQAKTYCEVCMTGHYGNCPKLKATLTYTTNLPSESEPKSSPKTISLDTPTIDLDQIILDFWLNATNSSTPQPYQTAKGQAKQALLQWHNSKVLEVIGEDDTYEGHIMNWAIEHRNVLRAEQRAKLGGE